MGVQNDDRQFVHTLRRLASQRGIHVEVIGKGWIIRFTKDATVRHAYGYSLDLNSAATHQLACDKSATSEILAAAALKHVPHHLFLHPSMARYAPHAGNWKAMMDLCEQFGWDAVLKENAGTGGRGAEAGSGTRSGSSRGQGQGAVSVFPRSSIPRGFPPAPRRIP